MKKSAIMILLMLVSILGWSAFTGNVVEAKSVLAAGDIAIIGVNTDDPDQFSFVAMVDIDAGVEIKFTDNGVHSPGNPLGIFRANEGIYSWIAPAGGVPAGTIITPDINPPPANFAFSVSGDQLIAYQGTEASPTFIYALQMNSDMWQSDATNSNTSALPPGLVNGITAVAIGSIPPLLADNIIYNMFFTSGRDIDILVDIGASSNWNYNDSSRYTLPPTGSFDILSSKWVQFPDLRPLLQEPFSYGIAVYSDQSDGILLADDFQCTSSGPITEIRIWGSWKDSPSFDPWATFNISIMSDIPDPDPNDPDNYSMPGETLWTDQFALVLGQYQVHEVPTGSPIEKFWSPDPDNPIEGIDPTVWQYKFSILPENAFWQTAGNTYWLSVTPTTDLSFGWKTAINHWNDDAVWIDVPDSWNISELYYPSNWDPPHPLAGQSIDLAFSLYGPPLEDFISVDIEKEADKEISKVGDTITYNLTVTNTSLPGAPPLILDSFTDTLVPGVVPPPEASPLAPGASYNFTYPYTVQPEDPDPLENTATIHYHPEGFSNDIWSTASASVDLLYPDYTLTKYPKTEPVMVGSEAVFDIGLENTGDLDLIVTLDEDVVDKDSNTIPAGTPITLPVGEDLKFTHTMLATYPEVRNTINASATVPGWISLQTASATCRVVRPIIIDPKTVELAVDADGDGVPSPGDTLKYTALISNEGDGPANGVKFSDTPDPNTKLVAGSVTKTQGTVIKGNQAGDKTVEVALGTILPAGSAMVTFEVTINSPMWEFLVANQAIVTGADFDPVKSDDPGTPKIGDATVTKVKMSPPVHGPGLSQWGIVVLVSLFSGAMVWVIRRRQIRSRIR